jgi:collagen type III alpha
VPFELWGQRGWPAQQVAGESHHSQAIRNLFGRQYGPGGAEIEVKAQLIPEPDNPHDPNAVAVRCGGATVGYLPRDDAARYAPVFNALVAQGMAPEVTARVWGGERSDYSYDRRGRLVESKRFVGSVQLDLAEPHLLVPANLPPAGSYGVLPTGRAIQVTGEDKHMTALTTLLSPEGECWIYVTLHELVEHMTRASRTVVEVRVDGTTAGTLTPKMSAELLPAIRHLAERGARTCARAILKGNRVKADVVLYAARANELAQQWLDHPPIAAGPIRHATAELPGNGDGPAEPAQAQTEPHHANYGTDDGQHWRFNAPPGWPPPPAGWVPAPGWRPDPGWPPAPEGWQFWVPAG